jgi:hypothetical protein
MEMKNKEYMINGLKEKTNRTEKECIIINDILENHFIIGHNNKDKIKKDFMEKLQISEDESDKLYNICAELIIKGTFK